MWISDTSIKRPVFATMVIMSFMVLGIVSLTRLGIDLFPDVNFPFVNVSVVYPGAGPEEVETLVTRPIEDAVAGINGVKRVISTSTEGFARVGLELRLEVDAQAMRAQVEPLRKQAEARQQETEALQAELNSAHAFLESEKKATQELRQQVLVMRERALQAQRPASADRPSINLPPELLRPPVPPPFVVRSSGSGTAAAAAAPAR